MLYCSCVLVLIDLRTKKITHQDAGQMDMYVRMYDQLKKEFNLHGTRTEVGRKIRTERYSERISKET